MGKVIQGINGAFSGKVGDVIGYVLNGQSVMRGKARKSSKKITALTINNRGKMKLLSKFFEKMKEVLKMSFTPESRGTVNNWYNLAVSYNNPSAIKGKFPELEIDYPNVVLSRGKLKQPVNVTLERTDKGVKFAWDLTDKDKVNHDHTVLVAYFPKINDVKYLIGGKKRRDGSDTLEISENLRGLEMILYIAFVSNDRQEFSNSLYAGKLEKIGTEKKVTARKVVAPVAQVEKVESPDQKILDIARNFKAMGIPLMNIAVGTGLTVKEIELL
ncbi:DUF6266 family protein [Pedobacter sp. MC2016-14]|uniref:DUF6266 family protein n=1 Tax=Pedobacter sp. MC2016-14 TaxID=2897327 RepID=UPI001E519A67|nr:DUF6266 family protein [Pedobacter sp. MC2016-14]MCD0490523.1 DUF6266 family protein [Pedobacter sp. MC2016-14]